MKVLKFIFRISLFVGYILIASYYRNTIFDWNFLYLIPIYLYFVFIALKKFLPKNSIAQRRFFKSNYDRKAHDIKKLNVLVKKDNHQAVIIMSIWLACLFILGLLYYFKIVDRLFIIGLVFFFNILDLVCLYIWCPFKIIQKNKCCSDCRIANWDSFFLFSPFIYILSFFTTSLFLLGVIILVIWEFFYWRRKEHFYKISNHKLSCKNCNKQCINKQ